MKIIACLPNYDKYKDRYRLFVEIAALGYSVSMLLLHGPHPPVFSDLPTFEKLNLPQNTNFFTRKRYIADILRNYVKIEKIILHDLFLSQLGFVSKRILSESQSRKVLSLYSPNPDFLFKCHWLGYKGLRCSPSEIYSHLKYALPDTFLEYLSCKKADMILGNTEQIVNDVNKYYKIPKSRTKFLLAEQDTSFFTPGNSVREELDLPAYEKIILYVGNLQRRKGVDIALKSFDIFLQKHKNSRLILIGKFVSDKYMWFSKILESLNCKQKVEIKENVDELTLKKYYRSCDLFFIPTRHEGCPRVVKEAMACGLPVLASDVAGIRAIDPSYKSITISATGDIYDYAIKMEKCVFDQDFQKNIVSSGLKLADNFKVENVALKLLDIYKQLF